MSGEAPELINVADYERAAAEVLEPGPHGYFAGGAGDERTLRDNTAAFSRWQLRPRALVDVSAPSAATRLLGAEAATPVMVAPVALQRLAHADGEQAMARAAAAAGAVFCLSTLATARPSEIAEAAPGGRRWFQLYCFRDRGVTQALIDEAVGSGFEAIALTVDAPYGGRRERDLRTGFQVPADVSVPSVAAAIGTSRRLTIAEVFGLLDPALTWRDLEQLASSCDVPMLVKGVLGADDARLAVEHGAAGIVVSNHGGRQLDGVPATLDVLPEAVAAVDGRADVVIDGGVRRGTDVLVALALGADAVMVGRPALWGLAVDGEEGAFRVLEILREELELALALCGCPTPDTVRRDHVAPAPNGARAPGPPADL
jgi:isopentenyl diphosphate isomerase/L-lactate dehydrogenase-like FMN-dependent dehydrogenase